jgi:hypothetical protein
VWRSTILPAPEGRGDLITAMLRDRRAALLYVGLLSLDDETLTWVGSNRATLLHLRKFPQIFASFGRSIHVRNGRIVVPGGADAEPRWLSITGGACEQTGCVYLACHRRDGRLAFLFDTIAHLDAAHQRFALGLHLGPATQEARLRALFRTFTAAAPEWRIGDRLFPKPPIDGAILLSALAVLPDGNLTPPISRRLWDRVFRGDELNDVAFERAGHHLTFFEPERFHP